MSTNTTILAYQGLAKSAGEFLDEALQRLGADQDRPSMDFSETSLAVLESAMVILATSQNSEQAAVMVDVFGRTLPRKPERTIHDQVIEHLSMYIFEVARRNLGLQWHVKGFLGKQFGLLNPRTGKFYSVHKLMNLVPPVEEYTKFKSEVLGIPLTNVQLSDMPKFD
jgi:hypothetical protein